MPSGEEIGYSTVIRLGTFLWLWGDGIGVMRRWWRGQEKEYGMDAPIVVIRRKRGSGGEEKSMRWMGWTEMVISVLRRTAYRSEVHYATTYGISIDKSRFSSGVPPFSLLSPRVFSFNSRALLLDFFSTPFSR